MLYLDSKRASRHWKEHMRLRAARQPPGYHEDHERWGLLQGLEETQEMKEHGTIRFHEHRRPRSSFPDNNPKHARCDMVC